MRPRTRSCSERSIRLPNVTSSEWSLAASILGSVSTPDYPLYPCLAGSMITDHGSLEPDRLAGAALRALSLSSGQHRSLRVEVEGANPGGLEGGQRRRLRDPAAAGS